MANTPTDPPALEAIPTAIPVEGEGGADVPMALPVAIPVSPAPGPAPTAAVPCPACGSEGTPGQAFCGECGYYFSPADPGATAREPAAPSAPLAGRYEL